MSFGLIKGNLAGLDPNFVAFARMAVSFVVFLPFLRVKDVQNQLRIKLVLTGMVQYGLMYAFYIGAFRYLQAYQVALFTILTPLYVTLLDDMLLLRLRLWGLAMAGMAVAGAVVISFSDAGHAFILKGFALVQASNLCFAFGQVYYRRTMRSFSDVPDGSIFALLYLGAVVLCGTLTAFSAGPADIHLGTKHVLTLLYLGFVASGLCFFLWNNGARKSDVAVLAILNNAKIPLAVAFSILIFGENASLGRLVIGGGFMFAALLLNHRRVQRRKVTR